MQLPLFAPESNWTPPAELPDWSSAKRVCLDTETFDPYLRTLGPSVRRGGHIVGFCVGIEDGPSVYAPIRHLGGGNMDAQSVIRWMTDCASRFTGDIVGMNLQYDMDFMLEEGIEFPNVNRWRDVMVADPLINELQDSYSLKAICMRWGIPGKDTTVLDEALRQHGYKDGGGIHALHSKYVGAYGEGDVTAPLRALKILEAQIDKLNLKEIWELESCVLPVLVKMRRRGVRVNTDKLDKIENWARAEQAQAMERANRHLSVRLASEDINRSPAMAAALQASGVPKTAFTYTTKNNVSITKDWIDNLDHPAAEHLRRAKKMSTLRTTFCDGVRKHIVNGRIHATFNQLRKTDEYGDEGGAAFGRLSSENPNLQNQPARDEEIGPVWRAIYEPEEGALWASKDFSQQEPRIAVHLASSCPAKLLGTVAYEAAQAAQKQYVNNPKTDFHDMMTKMIYGELPPDEHKRRRKFCKEIYLGLSYGMGAYKLCVKLGLPTKIGERNGMYYKQAGAEGLKLMDEFNSRVPFVRKIAEIAEGLAKQRGYIRTLGGRRCNFPLKPDGLNYEWTHKAFNRSVQGGAADQTKHALVALDRAGAFVQLQVHDELDSSIPDVATGQRYARIMEEAFPLNVPSKVDLEIGRDWGSAVDVEKWDKWAATQKTTTP